MEIRTLTGLDLGEVHREMIQVLPPRAYKQAPGAGGSLTSVRSAYMIEVLNRVFGPCGLGWWCDVDEIQVERLVREKRDGTPWEVWVATIDRCWFYYKLLVDGEERRSEAIVSNGGSENAQRHYAVRGAITQCIGGAASRLCWQLRVHKGILDQDNAPELYARYIKATGRKPEDEGSAAGTVDLGTGEIVVTVEPTTGEIVVDASETEARALEAARLQLGAMDIAEWLAVAGRTVEQMAARAVAELGFADVGAVFTKLHEEVGLGWKKAIPAEAWQLLGGAVEAGKAVVSNKGDGPVPHPWLPAMWQGFHRERTAKGQPKGKATKAQKTTICTIFGKLEDKTLDDRHDFQEWVTGNASLNQFSAAEASALAALMDEAAQAGTLETEVAACLQAYRSPDPVIDDTPV